MHLAAWELQQQPDQTSHQRLPLGKVSSNSKEVDAAERLASSLHTEVKKLVLPWGASCEVVGLSHFRMSLFYSPSLPPLSPRWTFYTSSCVSFR